MRVCLSSPLGVVEYSHDRMPKKMRLRSVNRWQCSGVCQSAFKFAGLDFLVKIYGILLVGLAFYSPLVVAVGLNIFDLMNLGLGRSEGASGRTQIHPIWRN